MIKILIENGNEPLVKKTAGILKREYIKRHAGESIIVSLNTSKTIEKEGFNIEGKDVILVDDLIDTAGTICKAAILLKEKGANSVRAVCTHPVLSGAAYENLEQSELVEIAVTDTIPLKKNISRIKVLSMSDLFAKAIRKIHDHESISSLFIRL